MKLHTRSEVARAVLLDALSAGESGLAACRAAGLHPSTIRRWRLSGDVAIDAAIAEGLRARAARLEAGRE